MSQPALITTERDWDALVAQTTVVLQDAEDVRQRVTATEEPQQNGTDKTQEDPMADPELLPEPGYDLDDDTTEDERRRRIEEEADAPIHAEAEADDPDLEP